MNLKAFITSSLIVAAALIQQLMLPETAVDSPSLLIKNHKSISAPLPPDLISPSEFSLTDQPEFSWKTSQGAEAYFLLVYDGTRNVHNTWFTSNNANCTQVTCSVKPSTRLSYGTYSWWVLAKNSAGESPWSSGRTFVYGTSTPPSVPVLKSPFGIIQENKPTFTWTGDPIATGFLVLLFDGKTNLISRWYTPSEANCIESTCTLNPGISLAPGSYDWWVQARNSTSISAWSQGKTFSLGGAQLPAAPVLVSPKGEISPEKPTFIWSTVEDASAYWLLLYDGRVNTVARWFSPSEANCTGMQCSITLDMTLAQKPYSWWVQARNSAGIGPWSKGITFSVTNNVKAPPYTTSYYMKTISSTAMTNLGCEIGKQSIKNPGRDDFLVTLAYGMPVEIGSSYGASLFGFGPVTTAQIGDAIKTVGRAYVTCSPNETQSHLRLGIGTSNYGSKVTEKHGAAWAKMVNDVNAWFASQGLILRVDAVGMNDMELSWNTVSVTRAWLKGYDSVNQYPLYNFGDAAGCPTRSRPTWPCTNGWSQEDVWYISYGSGASYALPLIYADSGVNAEQWALLSEYGFTRHGLPIEFVGVMTQYQSCIQVGGCGTLDNTPEEGWTFLYKELLRNPATAQYLRYSTDIMWHTGN